MSMHDPHGDTSAEVAAPAPVVVSPAPTTVRSDARRPVVVRRKTLGAPAPTTAASAGERIARAEAQLGEPKSAYYRNEKIKRELMRQYIEAVKPSGTSTPAPAPTPNTTPQQVTLSLGARELGLFEKLIEVLQEATTAHDTETDDEVVEVELPEDLSEQQYQLLVRCRALSKPLMVERLPASSEEARRLAEQIHKKLIEINRQSVSTLLSDLDALLQAEGAVTPEHEAVREIFSPDFFAGESAHDPTLLSAELRRRVALLVDILHVIASVPEEVTEEEEPTP